MCLGGKNVYMVWTYMIGLCVSTNMCASAYVGLRLMLRTVHHFFNVFMKERDSQWKPELDDIACFVASLCWCVYFLPILMLELQVPDPQNIHMSGRNQNSYFHIYVVSTLFPELSPLPPT